MRVFQVNSVYNIGSTGKIVHDMHTIFKRRGIDSYVVYGRGITSAKTVKDTHVIRLCTEMYAKANTARAIMTGLPYGGCERSTKRLIGLIRELKPDVVHLQCINEHFVNIYTLLEWLGKNRIPTVVTLHSEFMFTANCGHANDCTKWKHGCGNCPNLRDATRSLWLDRTEGSYRKMKRAFESFRGNLYVVSVSPWLEKRALRSPILKDKKHDVILNGLDTKVFCHRKKYSHIDTTEYKKYKRIIFHATAMFRDGKEDPKGGWYIIRLAERLKKDGVLVVVAGKYEIREKLPDNVKLLGIVRNQDEMAEYYSYADLTLVTSKRETFSMVCAESLCCGTPVAGFEAGGPETIALPLYTMFVPYGDTDELEKCVRKMLDDRDTEKNNKNSEQIAEEAAELYDRERMASKYIEKYERLMRSYDVR